MLCLAFYTKICFQPTSYDNTQIVTKFHYSKAPIAERLTHHTTLEMIWTVIPTIIVLAIAIPSLTLIYSMDQHTDRPGAHALFGLLAHLTHGCAAYQQAMYCAKLGWCDSCSRRDEA